MHGSPSAQVKLLPTQLDKAALTRLGYEAISLLQKEDFKKVADRFGYALAFDQSPPIAIENDFRTCLCKFGTGAERPSAQPSVIIKYFPPGDRPFVALVECTFTACEGCRILAELIVTSSGDDHFATLEQISLVTA